MTTHTEGEASVTDPAPTAQYREETTQKIKESSRTWYVRNNTAARFSSGALKLSLGSAGRGEDVQVLPKDIIEHPSFQRMWAQGKLTVSDDPAIGEEMINSANANKIRREEEYRKLVGGAEVEEPSSNRDLIEKKCLVSGERVYQTVAQIKNMVPPLAPMYKNRAHEFIPHVSQDDKGNEVVTFSRVSIEQ